MKQKRPLLIDCDPGIDDSVAISLAYLSGQFDIKAITAVSGNLIADICALNACKILDLLSANNIKVAKGPNKPLVRPYPRDPFSHGGDGLADLGLPNSRRAIDTEFASDAIVREANAAKGQLTLACLGPLTNLALAAIKDPELPNKIEKLVIIGGSFGFNSSGSERATGDNPVSEWNIYVDPEAADIVFNAGFDLYAVGLDVVTHPTVELSQKHRDMLKRSEKPAANFLLGVTDFVEKRGFKSYCGLIDGIAIAYLIDPQILKFEQIDVAVETVSHLSLGQTVVDRRENFRWDNLAKINAASEIDAERYLELLVNTLT